jgi:hypothetical protein
MSCLQYCFALCKINLFVKPFCGVLFWYCLTSIFGCYRLVKIRFGCVVFFFLVDRNLQESEFFLSLGVWCFCIEN